MEPPTPYPENPFAPPLSDSTPYSPASGPPVRRGMLAWWASIPAGIYILLECLTSWRLVPTNSSTSFVVGFTIGGIVAAVLIALLIAGFVYLISRRSQFASTITFTIVLAFFMLAKLNTVAHVLMQRPTASSSETP